MGEETDLKDDMRRTLLRAWNMLDTGGRLRVIEFAVQEVSFRIDRLSA